MTRIPQIYKKATLGREFLKMILHVSLAVKNRSLKFRDLFLPFFPFTFSGKGTWHVRKDCIVLEGAR